VRAIGKRELDVQTVSFFPKLEKDCGKAAAEVTRKRRGTNVLGIM
jgi:hypothetical protein